MVFTSYLLQMAKTKKNAWGKSCLCKGPLSSLKFFTIIKKTPCIINRIVVAIGANFFLGVR